MEALRNKTTIDNPALDNKYGKPCDDTWLQRKMRHDLWEQVLDGRGMLLYLITFIGVGMMAYLIRSHVGNLTDPLWFSMDCGVAAMSVHCCYRMRRRYIYRRSLDFQKLKLETIDRKRVRLQGDLNFTNMNPDFRDTITERVLELNRLEDRIRQSAGLPPRRVPLQIVTEEASKDEHLAQYS